MLLNLLSHCDEEKRKLEGKEKEKTHSDRIFIERENVCVISDRRKSIIAFDGYKLFVFAKLLRSSSCRNHQLEEGVTL